MEKNISPCVLIYGLFAALCHAVFILLHVLTGGILSAAVLAIRYVPMLEHTLMSILIVLIGALLIEITQKKRG